MTSPSTLLHDGPTCVVAFATPRGPRAFSSPFWWDGEGLWLTAPSSLLRESTLVVPGDAPNPGGPETLIRDTARCGVYVPPVRGAAAGAAGAGQARVYGSRNPVSLAVHAPIVSAAMAALAVKNAQGVPGTDLALRAPSALAAIRDRVAVRVLVEDLQPVEPPVAGPGIAPALPTIVPSDIRRTVAGIRQVVVAFQTASLVEVLPAVWSAGYALDAAQLPSQGTPVAVVAAGLANQRPVRACGIALYSDLNGGGLLRPSTAAWWRGADFHEAELPPPDGGIELPD